MQAEFVAVPVLLDVAPLHVCRFMVSKSHLVALPATDFEAAVCCIGRCVLRARPSLVPLVKYSS